MRKAQYEETKNVITVDLPRLQSMLCVGRATAEKIAREAKAVIRIGDRKLYKVSKIDAYLDSLASSGEEVG